MTDESKDGHTVRVRVAFRMISESLLFSIFIHSGSAHANHLCLLNQGKSMGVQSPGVLQDSALRRGVFYTPSKLV